MSERAPKDSLDEIYAENFIKYIIATLTSSLHLESLETSQETEPAELHPGQIFVPGDIKTIPFACKS